MLPDDADTEEVLLKMRMLQMSLKIMLTKELLMMMMPPRMLIQKMRMQ